VGLAELSEFFPHDGTEGFSTLGNWFDFGVWAWLVGLALGLALGHWG
jgi:hypothetical protein